VFLARHTWSFQTSHVMPQTQNSRQALPLLIGFCWFLCPDRAIDMQLGAGMAFSTASQPLNLIWMTIIKRWSDFSYPPVAPTDFLSDQGHEH
ncbi:MAG: hypothetical protein ACP5RV_11900, partial [Thiomonas sp.]